MREQAKIQFDKLLEVAQDIETYGNLEGDQQKRNIVMSGLINTENEYLYGMLDEALVNKQYPDILHTLICGIYLHKNRFASLASYVDFILSESLPLDETFEEKQALIFCAEGLIEACTNNDKVLAKKFLPTLERLFVSSCLEESSSILADKLLQIFLVRMSIENEIFSELLVDIINNKSSDFNAKLIAIDLLSRVDKYSCIEILINVFKTPGDYAQTGMKLLYLLDVTTKAIKFLKQYFDKDQLASILLTLNRLEYSVAEQDEYAQSIVERIQNRVKSLNEE